ncbi:MAG: conjugative transposon protein TraJ [Bacteroidetes bacterium]|nr:conjugative transposon protein TraJ [Bacteroidota bacterium]MBS1973403.1 conjugative transposon protein TraJ [Bacteroidota bacterium]
MNMCGMILLQSGIAGDIKGLQSVLDTIYDQMLPLCSSLIGIGRGIAGFAATWYIAYRVWRHIANAEPIDFYPLFRPFVIGFCILIFPSVIALMNAVLQPTVTATNSMVTNSDAAIAELLAQKQQAVQNSDFYKMYVGPDGNGDRDRWYQYTHPDDPTGTNEGVFESIGNDIKFAMAKMSYNFRNSIKEMMSEVLQVLYEAASLCINTIRTFYLIVLAILGPLVFGLSVFDGLHHTITVWIARYINIFLWLPVANIFGSIIGKIQQEMIKLDINQIQANGDTYFSSTDTGYLIFLIIGIIGYFTIPSVANYIVNAGGGNALLYKVSNIFSSSAKTVVSTAGTGMAVTTDIMSSGASIVADSISSQGSNGGFLGKYESNSADGSGSSGSFLANRIKGDTNDKKDS